MIKLLGIFISEGGPTRLQCLLRQHPVQTRNLLLLVTYPSLVSPLHMMFEVSVIITVMIRSTNRQDLTITDRTWAPHEAPLAAYLSPLSKHNISASFVTRESLLT